MKILESEVGTMKIIEFHVRITKTIKIKEFQTKKRKS